MNIIEQLSRDEGNIPYAYQDSRGFWTIGVGFLIDRRKGGGLDAEEIEFILNRRLGKVREALTRALPFYPAMDEVRRNVLDNMAYNLGPQGLFEFHHMLDACRVGDWEWAAREMEDSMWSGQVGDRAKRLAKQIRTGVWQ